VTLFKIYSILFSGGFARRQVSNELIREMMYGGGNRCYDQPIIIGRLSISRISPRISTMLAMGRRDTTPETVGTPLRAAEPAE
jgi:hypothetical protein